MLIGILALQAATARRVFADGRGKDADSGVDSPDEAMTVQEGEFDARILRIKDELAKQDATKRTGYSADELHPSVHNLPHNTIAQEHSGIPDVEYAD